jgi:transcriptional regulator with XRE-family HTH domain
VDVKKKAQIPFPVKRALEKLGRNLRDARLRRRISMAIMSERVDITPATLARMENGDPGVSMGSYATALFVLWLHDRLSGLAYVSNDRVGLALEEERLPQRIYRRRSRKTS